MSYEDRTVIITRSLKKVKPAVEEFDYEIKEGGLTDPISLMFKNPTFVERKRNGR